MDQDNFKKADEKLAHHLKKADVPELAARNLRFGLENAAAATALGIDLGDVTVVEGVATINIGRAETLLSADVATVAKFLKAQGATAVNVYSGFVINQRLEKVLRYLARTGKDYPGGGKVNLVDDELNSFQIIFELGSM